MTDHTPSLWDVEARRGSAFPVTLAGQFEAWLATPDGQRVRHEVIDRARSLHRRGWQHFGIAAYHYSGNAGPENGTFWGFYLGDLACVVGFGIGANQYGLAKKFDLSAWPGNIEICRVAAHPDAPRNTASRAVAAVLRTAQVPAGTTWVYSYADTGQNHHGGIYQALRAVYVGLVPAMHGWMLDGLPVHPRTIVDTFGTQARETAPRLAADRGRALVYVEGLNTAKHTYILPIGQNAEAIRAHLQRWTRPYPKRAA